VGAAFPPASPERLAMAGKQPRFELLNENLSNVK